LFRQALSKAEGGGVFHKPQATEEELVLFVKTEIERSQPLDPIRLTATGDYLREYPPRVADDTMGTANYLVNHIRDNTELLRGAGCIGYHLHCGGELTRRGASETSDAIVCSCCGRLALFDDNVRTYGDLRRELAMATTIEKSRCGGCKGSCDKH
jgi:hypothetical protein